MGILLLGQGEGGEREGEGKKLFISSILPLPAFIQVYRVKKLLTHFRKFFLVQMRLSFHLLYLPVYKTK